MLRHIEEFRTFWKEIITIKTYVETVSCFLCCFGKNLPFFGTRDMLVDQIVLNALSFSKVGANGSYQQSVEPATISRLLCFGLRTLH